MTNKSRVRWSAVPAARSSSVVLKARLRLVLGLLLFSSVAGIFSLFAWIGNRPPPPPVIPPVAESTGFATSATFDWLAGKGTSLPTAENVSEDLGGNGVAAEGVEGVEWSSFEKFDEDGRSFELHRFTLAGDPPRQLLVTVEITKSGPVLAADPALVPFTDAGGPTPAADRSTSPSNIDTPAALSAAATDWGSAFAEDNREELANLTGDLEQRTYVGLGGFTSTGARVASIADLGKGLWLARVEVDLKKGTFTSRTSYDVLVTDGDTADPKIVSWGAPGQGPLLRPFDVGIRTVPGAATTTTTTVNGAGSSTTTTP